MRDSKVVFLGLILLILSSCAKDPVIADQAELGNTTDSEIRATVEGIYATMADYRYMGRDYILINEVRADNVYSSGRTNRFGRKSRMSVGPNDLDVDHSVMEVYRFIYEAAAKANIVINADYDKIEAVEGSEEDINHSIGEAYIARAMVYFDLLRSYGQQYIDEGDNLGIIYEKVFRPDDISEVSKARGSVEENKEDMYNDIERGIDFLEKGQGSSYDSDRTNITLDAAYALKSSIGVYFGYSNPADYDKAIEGAEKIIDNYSFTSTSDYVDYWKSTGNSVGEESIFELARSTDNNDGGNAVNRMYRGDDYGDIEVFNNILEDAEFDKNDVRASKAMIDYEGPKLRNMGKYPSMGTKEGTDNFKKIRYAEVVLNYAEALLNKDPSLALHYLNEVALARNATPYSEANMDNILKERRKELLFEGFRFFDLARTGRDIPEMDPSTPNNHGLIPAGNYKFALPIPQHETDSNPNMVQNPGY